MTSCLFIFFPTYRSFPWCFIEQGINLVWPNAVIVNGALKTVTAIVLFAYIHTYMYISSIYSSDQHKSQCFITQDAYPGCKDLAWAPTWEWLYL